MPYSRCILGVLLAVTACAASNDLRGVAKAVEKEYHTPARVSLPDSTRLAVTFDGVPDQAWELDSAGKVAFARTVAGYARAHYPKRSEVTNVMVVFAARSGGGLVVATEGNGPFQFTAGELP
jgi:hypothetical protein